MSEMNVSSIIPVYNGEKYLAEAIESILPQSCQSSEILVLDDGSTDNTRKIVERLGSCVHYHFQSNQGLGAARNEAIRRAQGEFLAFLDADDVWTEEKLSLQTRAMRDDPSILLVGGHVANFFTPGLEESIKRQVRSSTEPQPAPVVPAALIHRSVFERAGLIATNWKVGVDLDWFLRVKEAGIHVHILSEVAVAETASRQRGLFDAPVPSPRGQEGREGHEAAFLDIVRAVDPDGLTPVQALVELDKLVREARKRQ